MNNLLDETVKEVRLYKNAIMTNEHRKMAFVVKRYIEVEFASGTVFQLKVDSGTDITNCDYINVFDKGKFVKYLFKRA